MRFKMQAVQILLTVLLTLGLYFSSFFVLLTPLPLFYLSLAHSKKVWGASLFLVCLASLGVCLKLLPGGPTFFPFFYLSFYLLIALFLSLGVFKRWSFVSWGFKSAISITALLFFSSLAVQHLGLYDISSLLKTSLSQASEMLDQMKAKPELIPFILQMKEWLPLLPKLIPSFLFILTLFVMAFNISVLKFLTSKRYPLQWAGRFQDIEVPVFCVWVLIVFGLLFFVDPYLLKLGLLKMASLNCVLGVLFVYFIQGLSILTFFLARFSPLFRFIIYGLVLLFLQLLGLVVVGLGLADVWVDFRKRHKVKS